MSIDASILRINTKHNRRLSMSIDKNEKNQNDMLYHKNEYFIMVGFLYKKAKTLGYKKKKKFYALSKDGILYQFNRTNNNNNKNCDPGNDDNMFQIEYDELNALKQIHILNYINKPTILQNNNNNKNLTYNIQFIEKKNGKMAKKIMI